MPDKIILFYLLVINLNEGFKLLLWSINATKKGFENEENSLNETIYKNSQKSVRERKDYL